MYLRIWLTGWNCTHRDNLEPSKKFPKFFLRFQKSSPPLSTWTTGLATVRPKSKRKSTKTASTFWTLFERLNDPILKANKSLNLSQTTGKSPPIFDEMSHLFKNFYHCFLASVISEFAEHCKHNLSWHRRKITQNEGRHKIWRNQILSTVKLSR